jgi:hypothetical protein
MIDASSSYMNGISNHQWIGDVTGGLLAMKGLPYALDRSEMKGYSHWPVGPHAFSSENDTHLKKPRTNNYSSPSNSVSPRKTSSSIYSSPPSKFRDMNSTSQIQQRLDELNVKEKSLIEERQILTEQLARLRQNEELNQFNNSSQPPGNSSQKPVVNAKNGTVHLKRAYPDEIEAKADTEVLSVLSPASQRVLQQVLHQNNSKDQVVNPNGRETGRDKVSRLNEDSPYKPKYSKQSHSTPRRQSSPPMENTNVSSMSPTIATSPVQTTMSDGEQETTSLPNQSPEDQKLSLAFSDPKSISSLQRLSRRVKIVMKPSGQIFPRQRVNQNGLFNPETINSPSPNITPMPTTPMVNEYYTSEDPNRQTDVFDQNNTDDNWLSWDEI